MAKSKYYKHPKFGHVYGEDIRVPVSRVAWPYLVTPRPMKEGSEGAPRFEVTFLLPKEDPQTEFFLNAMKTMSGEMVELFNKGRGTSIAITNVVGDGDNPWPGFDKDAYPYYAGNWIVTARNTQLPTIVGPEKTPIEGSVIKAGMKCKAVVTPIVTSHGVSYKLGIIQLIEDDGTSWGFKKDLTAMLDDAAEPAKTNGNGNGAAESKKALTGKQAALDKI